MHFTEEASFRSIIIGAKRLQSTRITAVAIVGILFGMYSNSLPAEEVSEKNVPVPDVGKYQNLRVLLTQNPRYPAQSARDVQNILSRTSALLKLHLNIRVNFSKVETAALPDVLSKLSNEHRQIIKEETLNIVERRDFTALQNSLERDLLRNGGSLASLKMFASEYIVNGSGASTIPAFARAVADTHLSIFKKWQNTKLPDAKPILEDGIYQNYLAWLLLGSTSLPYELVITNQPIVSAERSSAALHSSLRGGLTNGLTGPSWKSGTGAFSVLSTFAMFSPDPATRQLQEGAVYSEGQSLDFAAAILAHELGHQLLQLGHPFGNPACLMRPPVRLRFAEWYKKLDGRACAMHSSDEMTPGKTVTFPDIR